MNPGVMKEFTGNDRMYIRGLYQDDKDIKMVLKLALVCFTPLQLESDQKLHVTELE